MASPPAAADPIDRLTEVRQRARYNTAEQEFSLYLQDRLQQLLEGKCNTLELLRRYPGESDRLGVMVTPDGLAREELRLPVVESLVWDAITFACTDSRAGPVSQEVVADGSVYEFQMFSTRYPHIVVERMDHFVADSEEPADITWCIRRVQNQRTQTQFNRLLDAANLTIDLIRMVR